MKKKAFLAAIAVSIGSIVGIYSSHLLPNPSKANKSMIEEFTGYQKLVNHQTEFTLVTIEGNTITFFDPILRNELEASGIAIPPEYQEHFGGKEVVYMDDPQFAEAFYTHYSKFVFDPESYVWEALDN